MNKFNGHKNVLSTGELERVSKPYWYRAIMHKDLFFYEYNKFMCESKERKYTGAMKNAVIVLLHMQEDADKDRIEGLKKQVTELEEKFILPKLRQQLREKPFTIKENLVKHEERPDCCCASQGFSIVVYDVFQGSLNFIGIDNVYDIYANNRIARFKTRLEAEGFIKELIKNEEIK